MMKPLFVQGLGILSSRGRGTDKFEKSLCDGWRAPTLSNEGRLAHRIAKEDLVDRDTLKDARRADRFSTMTILAACDAIRDSGQLLEDVQQSTGIIIATALGPHATIFKFLDGVIDYGEMNVSPTTFAHSIHNSAASYVAGVLGCKGPSITVTSFHFSFQQALLLAYAWLNEGRVSRILVGTSEECSTPMEYICAQKLSPSVSGQMEPLSCLTKPQVVLGEGSVFFLVTLEPSKKKYGCFSDIQIESNIQGWVDSDLSILSGHGMAGSEKIYADAIKSDCPSAAFVNLYGGMLSAGAFECAAAISMLKNQVRYASPVFNYDGPFTIDKKNVSAPLHHIQCVSHKPEGQLAFVRVSL